MKTLIGSLLAKYKKPLLLVGLLLVSVISYIRNPITFNKYNKFEPLTKPSNPMDAYMWGKEPDYEGSLKMRLVEGNIAFYYNHRIFQPWDNDVNNYRSIPEEQYTSSGPDWIDLGFRFDEDVTSYPYITKDPNKGRYYFSVLYEDFSINQRFNSLYVLDINRDKVNESVFFKVLSTKDTKYSYLVPFVVSFNESNLVELKFHCTDCEPALSQPHMVVKLDFENERSTLRDLGLIKNLEWGTNNYYSYIPIPEKCLVFENYYDSVEVKNYYSCLENEPSAIITEQF